MILRLVVVSIVFLLGACVVVLFLVMGRGRKRTELSTISLESPITSNGTSIPLLAAFAGIRDVPLICFGRNSLSPELVLYPDSFRHKVIFAQTSRYDEVAEVSVRHGYRTELARFTFRDKFFTFDANLNNAESLKKLVSFLKQKGIPLSKDAEELISK